MYTITGVTGHVGPVATKELLSQGWHVRAVVRDPAQSKAWEERGADIAVADFSDRVALSEALRGSDGAFVLLPSIPTGDDTDHRRMADSIAGAVGDSGIRHVVMLSSIGADLVDGTGPVRWLHHFEVALRETGVLLSAIRSPHFQEKVEPLVGTAREAGIYPVFGESADVPSPMVATRDIGKAVAETLLLPPSKSEVVDLVGLEYSEREVAQELGTALGRHLQVVTIPRSEWLGAMTDEGLPLSLAQELAALYDAEQKGLFQHRGDRSISCETRIDETFRHLVGAIDDQPPVPPADLGASA